MNFIRITTTTFGVTCLLQTTKHKSVSIIQRSKQNNHSPSQQRTRTYICFRWWQLSPSGRSIGAMVILAVISRCQVSDLWVAVSNWWVCNTQIPYSLQQQVISSLLMCMQDFLVWFIHSPDLVSSHSSSSRLATGHLCVWQEPRPHGKWLHCPTMCCITHLYFAVQSCWSGTRDPAQAALSSPTLS